MKATHLETDQNWNDETTVYWFDVNNTTYGISDSNGEMTLVDYEGYPIDECNDHEGIKGLLIEEIKELN